MKKKKNRRVRQEERMPRRGHHVQEDLFQSSGDDVRRRVRELDSKIASALKKKKFDEARKLSDEQKKLIRQLVENSEKITDHQKDI